MESQELRREVSMGGAVLLGLGSILGTGVFVSLGLGAEQVGAWILGALVVGAVVAALNGLSSARLAARYPVSGGTYEYGHRVLHPLAGYAAGWCFLCAKSASGRRWAIGCGWTRK